MKNKAKCAAEDGVAVVKKYANRRLYNTASSSYVTLDDLSKMVRDGDDFVVYDAKTGEDLTRSILTQIIMEEDSKGRNLLPTNFLRQLIRFYDDSLRAFLPRYLEMSMENFSSNQDQIRNYIEGTFGRFFPINQFEDMARQNISLFQQAATMFNPGASGTGETSERSGTPNGAASPSEASDPEQEIQALNERIESLQAELSKLVEAQKGKPKR
ncbi:MAG: polyhydroxyalkanoate synthesis repressor PhaR [Alphaproteobacteria bacterium]|nr:polyhydroxyalkanoate synthesis repressor PhaR [Alphaproteobacteria bacterium]